MPQGSLVGINTAIYSRSGGNMGIGFAIPVDSARTVMDALLRDGRVTRGWIGVEPRDLTPELAASLRLQVTQGVLITGVLQDGPASRGGMRPGDVVTAIGGAEVSNTAQLLAAVAALQAADRDPGGGAARRAAAADEPAGGAAPGATAARGRIGSGRARPGKSGAHAARHLATAPLMQRRRPWSRPRPRLPAPWCA